MLMKMHPIIHERVNYIPGVITAIKKSYAQEEPESNGMTENFLFLLFLLLLYFSELFSLCIFFKQDDLTAFVVV